ncbi:uncharacterized protein Dana_GF16165 [Drosophila ananassae]|uniref:Pro-corazonin n=1 Tax=Drosophila ananassae TaxID=7217 RepID=B3LZX2_DROAN|nr:pro-corazonin [Drosophila ananassae]EDV44162.2 uncharacterized protein Dana_GF16165 [Drosophila ananassae]
MMRLLLLPLFLLSLSVACMGQTFQYSRGWTNGKRALHPVSPLITNGYFHRINELGFSDLDDMPDGKSDRWLQICLSKLQKSLINRNPGEGLSLKRVDTDSGDINLKSRLNNNNIDHVLYSISNPNRNQQTNDIFEEFKTTGRILPETNVYGKQ